MQTKRINLALQGGGAHGAYTWGVLDRLLEEDRLEVEAISGTSAGAMNAAVFADGLGRGWNLDHSTAFVAFDMLTRMLSPYQFNPMNFNPLRDALTRSIDFKRLEDCRRVKLF